MNRIRTPRAPGDPRGFTGVEILVVLAVLGVLAGVGYAAAGQHRVRAAEAEMRQDLVHFANQQQVLRQRTGALGTLEQLDSLGFRRSPGVVVETERVDAEGRRAYLRVRHTRTGQRCSVDYSPFVSNALNRIQCWGGPDDPLSTERPAAEEGAPTAPGALAAVDTPAGPLVADACAGVPAVAIDAPEDQSAPPGSARTGVFTLANPGAYPRTYSLRFSSSNPAVVPSVDGPATVEVPAGASRTVAAAFQVDAGAEAGQVAVVPLEAADAACQERTGSGFFSVAAELWLASPGLSRPADVTVRPGEPIPVLWSSANRTNATRMLVLAPSEQAGLVRESGAGLGSHPYTLGETRETALRYHLDEGIDGFERRQACMELRDAEAPAYASRECFWATAEFLPGAPRIVPPAARQAGQDEQFTTAWTVVNTSNAPRPFRILPAAGGDLVLVAAEGTGPSVLLARGVAHTVRVTYRLKRPSRAGTVSRGSLSVADVDGRYEPASSGSGELVVTTRVELCAPAVAAAPAGRTEQPGAAFSAIWQIRNCSNTPRDLALAPAGDADVLATGTARVESFGAFELRSVEFPFQVKERSVYRTTSRPALHASDADLATPARFGVTTGLTLCAPALSSPAGVPVQPQPPGTGAKVAYTVRNCSNEPRAFSASVSSSGAGAVPNRPDPATLTIPAYASATVSFDYVVPVDAYGGVPSELAIRVEDDGDASLAAAGGFQVTPRVIRSAPALSVFPAQLLLPGQSGSASATLASRSNVPVHYCFGVAVGAGSVAGGHVVSPVPAPAGCVTIEAPFGTASVTQPLSVAADAEHPWTNQVTVTAADQADGSLSAAQTFSVTAGLQLASPTVQVPATPPAVQWRGGQTRAMEYRVRNQSNATRILCVAVATSDSALLSSSSANPVCAQVGARQAYPFSHSLRAALARTADVSVSVQAYDQAAPSFQEARAYLGHVVSASPVAAWTSPGSVYVRRWADFSGVDSYSPVGTAIVKYIWTWGLEGLRWDGVRFAPGGVGLATDSSASATARRAFDSKGTFPICLTVVDAHGLRSEPNCQDLNTRMQTRARLQWRYRGWWHDPNARDFCWDVPWDNQCPLAAGNARWEVLLNASQGDVPIRRAWATISVKWWNTDDPHNAHARTYTYSGNSLPVTQYAYTRWGKNRTYDFFSNDQNAWSNVQEGVWRVLDTQGSGAGGWPQGHPLILNAHMGSATGAFDGGPHWVPDNARVTLYVEADDGAVTSETGSYDHKRAEWRGSDCINGTTGFGCTRGFEQLSVMPSAPTGVIAPVLTDGVHRLTGSGQSKDGRVVDMYWEVSDRPFNSEAGEARTYTSRSDVLELPQERCMEQDVSLILVDDQGRVGFAAYTVPSLGRIQECTRRGNDRVTAA